MLFHPKRKYNKAKGFLKSLQPKAIILLYHRVIDLEIDPQMLAISINNFESQIQYLSEKYTVVPVKDLLSSKLTWSSKRKLAITFDDGYFDNYSNALPILKKYKVPATIFVSSGFIGSKNEFWWDELERAVLINPNIPDSLIIKINGIIHKYDNVKLNKEIVYYNLVKIFQTLPIDQIKDVIEYLKRWGRVEKNARNTHRCMDLEELVYASNSGLIEIGAHTVNHCKLSNENIAVQKNEIEFSKKQLEKFIGKDISIFAYPFGASSDYTHESLNFVKDIGFSLGLSATQGLIFNKHDNFQIPRFIVRNWDPIVFKRNLDCIYNYNIF